MIRSFADRRTTAVFHDKPVRGIAPDLRRRARRKLIALATATELDELRVPPGNRLEALKGDRAGQHSIRVNDQWRICFVWHEGDAYHVELVDYH